MKAINNFMAFNDDTLQLESMYSKIHNTYTLQNESAGVYLKSAALGAVLGLLTSLLSPKPIFNAGNTSSLAKKTVLHTITDIEYFCTFMQNCLNKRASVNDTPVDVDVRKQLKHIHDQCSNSLRTVASRLTPTQVDELMEKLKDLAYALHLEDEPGISRWGVTSNTL